MNLFTDISYKMKFITRILNNRAATFDYFSLNVGFIFKCCTTNDTELFAREKFRNLQ